MLLKSLEFFPQSNLWIGLECKLLLALEVQVPSQKKSVKHSKRAFAKDSAIRR